MFNWLFPFSCIGCEKVDFIICLSCKVKLKGKLNQDCPYCRTASPRGEICPACQKDETRRLDGLITIFNYEKNGLVAKLLHYYKYDQLEEYGRTLVTLFKEMAEPYKTMLRSYDTLITWVPMTSKKLRRRGFNQSEVLARGLEWGEPAQLVEKVRESRAQMSLKRKDRLNNLNDAFKLTAEGRKVAGRRIIIVDDIATTLATLEEVAKVLKAAGAKQIYGLTVARQKA